MGTTPLRSLVCFAMLALVACGDSSPAAAPGPDASPVDATTMDVADIADVARRCASDADCAGAPGGPACDVAAGRCVRCTATSDLCPADQHCDPTSNLCLPGCRSDEGCAMASSDGGTSRASRCAASTHACVECVTDAHCPAGSLCVGNTCAPGCNEGRACPTGQTCCASACVDTQSNLVHCGACGTRCAVVNATPACMNGNCAVGACTSPFADCDTNAANGCEADTLTSTAHCGGCGHACEARAGTSVTCAGGACRYVCDEGSGDCDGNAANGCEVDLRVSTAHCGACARECAPANATAACVAGVCRVMACGASFGDCDGNASNGCEVDLRLSASNCGECGRVCLAAPHTVPACVTGACAATCAVGYGECNGDRSDGCEADLTTSPDHCGACGRSCLAANVTAASCAMGACHVTTCADNFANCDGNASNGCEVDLRRDRLNCGRCGARGSAESCNGLDDDCDGFVDEEVPALRSNVDTADPATAALAVAGAVTVNTDTGEISGGRRAAGVGVVSGIGFHVVAQGGGAPSLGVFTVTGLSVAAGASLDAAGNNALVVVSLGACTVEGAISVAGAAGTVGASESTARPGGVGRAGGGNGGDGAPDGRPEATGGYGGGAGGAPIATYHYGNGGGGAGFGAGGGGGATDSCGADGTASAGGAGSAGPYDDRGGNGGASYGAAGLVPLLAGSGGGGGSIDTDNGPPDGAAGGGGAGGGAVQLSCAGEITVASTGAVRANGGNGGNSNSGGGGAGSGGAVLLEACRVRVDGAVEAFGGRGGRGYMHIGAADGSGARGGIDRIGGGGRACGLSGGGGGGEGRIRVRVPTMGDATLSTAVHPAAVVGP